MVLVILLVPVGPVEVNVEIVILPLEASGKSLSSPIEIPGGISGRVQHGYAGILAVWTRACSQGSQRINIVLIIYLPVHDNARRKGHQNQLCYCPSRLEVEPEEPRFRWRDPRDRYRRGRCLRNRQSYR